MNKVASALRKLFKSSDRHQRKGGWRRSKNSDSPNHSNQSTAMRFFGHCASPRKRDTNKICPEDNAKSQACGEPSNASPSRCFKSLDGPSLKQIQTVRSRRLMKEFQEIAKSSQNQEKPPFVAELVDDNLYEWNVKLYQIDSESDFYHDMQESDIRHVLLNIVFPENFPFSPPFMRVITPHVEKGFVMEGGAICMELLTPRGWASAYTIEAVVMQFAASLVKGQGRIARKCKTGKEFSKKSAEASFRSLVKTHDKYGWVTPPLADG